MLQVCLLLCDWLLHGFSPTSKTLHLQLQRVSFWYCFSFQTTLLDNQRCFTWRHVDYEGWVSQLYDPTGITWKILCMGIHAFSGSIEFYQFLKADNFLKHRLLPSICPLLPVCPHLVCGLWTTVDTLQHSCPFSDQSLSSRQPRHLDFLLPMRKERIFSETPVGGLPSFCFFPTSLLRGQFWHGLHMPVLFPKAAASLTPPLG